VDAVVAGVAVEETSGGGGQGGIWNIGDASRNVKFVGSVESYQRKMRFSNPNQITQSS
jgi:hypothetical protein